MVEEKKDLTLYGIIGEAMGNAETEFYESIEENDIDIMERKIYLKMEVFEILDDEDGKKMITLGTMDNTLRAVK